MKMQRFFGKRKEGAVVFGMAAALLAFSLIAASCTFSATDDKAGSNNNGGSGGNNGGSSGGTSVLAKLVGVWYRDAALTDWVFTIAADGIFTLPENNVKYTTELFNGNVVFCKNAQGDAVYTLSEWRFDDNGRRLTVLFKGEQIVLYKK
jgi:hypothetical protein